MIPYFCLLLVNIIQRDEPTTPMTQFSERGQSAFVELFFGNIQLTYLNQISRGDTNRSICKWEEDSVHFRLSCTNGALVRLGFDGVQKGNFNLAFTPPSVVFLLITNCDQATIVETRYFPAQVRIINLSHNEYFGSLHLAGLPSRVETFEASHNMFSGKISMMFLPDNMKRVDLSSNRFKQETLFYQSLPDGLIEMNLKENRIRSIKYLGEDINAVIKAESVLKIR